MAKSSLYSGLKATVPGGSISKCGGALLMAKETCAMTLITLEKRDFQSYLFRKLQLFDDTP